MMEAGRDLPSCAFCGRDALAPLPQAESVEPPARVLPFRVDARAAREAFERFAKGSIWHPSDLRAAALELRPVFVAAWAWSAEVETCWAAMVPARTRSGVEPVADSDLGRHAVLVPASRLVSRAELHALGDFDASDAVAFDEQAPPGEHEMGTLTRSIAEVEARRAIENAIRASIAARTRARRLATSHLMRAVVGEPVLVPAWVGAYRHRDRAWRVLVHGQTGRFVGKGPVSGWRVLAAVALGVAGLLALAAILSAS